MNRPDASNGGASSSGPRRTLALAVGFACLVLALHVACGNRYGVFRDELYFIACGRHLAWGYVDQPPLVAVVARVTAAIFGTTPLGLRVRPLWIGGLLWLLADARRRWLGLAFALVTAELVVLHGKPYYLAPAFPVLFGGGGCAAERVFGTARWRSVALAVVLVAGLAVAPIALPLLPPETFVRFEAVLGLRGSPTERSARGALPQVFADEHGWPEMVAAVARAWDALPPDVRAHAIVYAANYGEAGAVDLYGPRHGLPPAFSGHNNYWLWGPPPADTAAALVIGGRGEDHRRSWEDVQQVGETPDSAWNMPYERRRPIWLLRTPRRPIAELWRHARMYI